MEILIAITSILGITGAFLVINRIGNIKICPICAGVFGTWLWMLIGVLSGRLSVAGYQLPVAILMGGSVVGIAYQIEKRLLQSSANRRTPLLWKMLFIPIGFVVVYSVLSFWRLIFIVLAVFLLVLTLIFVRQTKNKAVSEKQNRTVGELEKKMKNCC